MFHSVSPRSRFRQTWRAARAFLLAGMVLGLLGLGLTSASAVPRILPLPTSSGGGPGGPGGPSAIHNVSINATDAPSFSPNGVTVPAGTVVRFELINQGFFNHTFTLSRVPNVPLDPKWSPAQLFHFFNVNGTFANVSLAPRSTTFTNVSIPGDAAGGSFEFTSVVPYQFQAGMSGFVNVSGATGPGVQLAVAGTNAFSWDPGVLAVNATTYPVAVDIQVSNLGTFPHTFVIASTPDVNLSTSNFTTFLQQHPPLATATVPLSAGSSVWANFTVNTKGVYEFICTVPGHFQAGMFGFLYVGVPPPAVAAPPSTAIVQEGILVGGAALLGVGAVLAAVAALVGRFPPRTASADHH
ncbi:MAG: plastocyanin/azurin family copper-binding protein [Thermoplasmata archaeon]|nr:plastocyanin/azurin family copper-binding protein [Thermoplasmata archaeon]